MRHSEPLTLQAFLHLPEEKPALEYIDGVLTQKSSPRTRHSALRAALVEHLNHAGRHGASALAFPESRTTFAGASVVPDIAVYHVERLPLDEQGEYIEDLTVPPDIAIEIVSPQQRVAALERRCAWYVAHGVRIALLVDPDDRSVFAFRLDRPIDPRTGADRIDLSEVIPGFELTVEGLFASLRPK